VRRNLVPCRALKHRLVAGSQAVAERFQALVEQIDQTLLALDLGAEHIQRVFLPGHPRFQFDQSFCGAIFRAAHIGVASVQGRSVAAGTGYA